MINWVAWSIITNVSMISNLNLSLRVFPFKIKIRHKYSYLSSIYQKWYVAVYCKLLYVAYNTRWVYKAFALVLLNESFSIDIQGTQIRIHVYNHLQTRWWVTLSDSVLLQFQSIKIVRLLDKYHIFYLYFEDAYSYYVVQLLYTFE